MKEFLAPTFSCPQRVRLAGKVELEASGELAGPDTGDLLLCTLGLACDVEVTGYGLDTMNGIVLLSAGECGGSEESVTALIAAIQVRR